MSLSLQLQALLAQVHHQEFSRSGAYLPLAEKLASLLSSVMAIQLDMIEIIWALKCFNVSADSSTEYRVLIVHHLQAMFNRFQIETLPLTISEWTRSPVVSAYDHPPICVQFHILAHEMYRRHNALRYLRLSELDGEYHLTPGFNYGLTPISSRI